MCLSCMQFKGGCKIARMQSQNDTKSQCMQYSPGALVGSPDVCIQHENTGGKQQCT